MPLGARDILLVIRATDQASATVSRVAGSFGQISTAQAAAAQNTLKHGAALTMLGAGLLAVGKQGFDALNSWRKAASDYNQQAALTLTQLDDTSVKLDDIKKIGREVAMAIPAPFEQMQASLYDIFSSMEVNTAQAQDMLEQFAKAAVAGQTDVQTAGRGSIAVMNAFQIPVENVSQVMDTQFQLVRKGVGTYEEFAVVLGRIAPSAVRLGQNFETVAGMLAFMTRNGLSTQQAATSGARALDALSKTTVADRLQKMGVAIRDANGEFRPLVDIVGQMNEKFKDLSKPERAKVLEDLFKGAGGTIQARRFFDTVFDNFALFEQMVGDMQHSAGAMDKAYDIMFAQPQSKMDLFKNRLQVIRTELGDHLLDAFNKLYDVGNKVTEWFQGLSDGTKKGIVQFIAFASAATMVVGAVFAAIGVFLILKATLALAAVSFGTVLAAAGGIIVVIAAIAAGAFLIYKNWDTLGPKFKTVFEALKHYAEIAWEMLQDFADWVMTWLPGVWDEVQSKATTAWNAVVSAAQTAWRILLSVVNWLVTNVPPAFQTVQEAATTLWGVIQHYAGAFIGWLQENVFPVFIAFADMVVAFTERVMRSWNWLWASMEPVANFGLGAITTLFTFVFSIWQAAFTMFSGIVMAIWEPLWNFAKEIVSVAFNFIKQTIESYLAILTGIFNFFAALFRGDWSGMWDAVKQIAAGAWQWITNIFNTAFDLLFAIVRNGMNVIWQAIQAGWDGILNFLRTVPGAAFNALAAIVNLLWDLGWRAMDNMLSALSAGASNVLGWAYAFPGKVTSALAALAMAGFGIAADLIQGIVNGLLSAAGKVYSTAQDIANTAVRKIKDALSIFSPSRVMHNIGQMTGLGLANGIAAMIPLVERRMATMAERITGEDLTVPVGWSDEGGTRHPRAAGNPFEGSTFDIDININGEGLDARQIAEQTAEQLESALRELYRELQTGVRR